MLLQRLAGGVLTAVFACLLLAGIRLEAAPETPRPRVLASVWPVYCWTAAIAGDAAQVDALLASGLSPHDYQFSRRDLQKVAAADLIVVNGLGLEPWLPKLLKNAPASCPVVEAFDGISDAVLIQASAPERSPGRAGVPPKLPNPHAWLDPQLASHAVTNLLRALQKAKPPRAEGYARRAAEFVTRLARLDAELQAGLAPYRGSAIVTLHDAFPYFARRYGLKVVGVVEPVPEVNPSPRHLAELRRTMREQRVNALFLETGVTSKTAERLAADLGVRLAALDTLETGPLVPTAFEDGMRRNLRTLQEALR
jgi:zinc/manganese transport system substrate-binding protein